tara:strand:- start:186 stop:308 length:123 start_codon:yes stop_codon:yes gene_type:complete
MPEHRRAYTEYVARQVGGFDIPPTVAREGIDSVLFFFSIV